MQTVHHDGANPMTPGETLHWMKMGHGCLTDQFFKLPPEVRESTDGRALQHHLEALGEKVEVLGMAHPAGNICPL